ncbi:stress responsive a b barrel domain protein [Colletotrichum truncatum]|uniref:Stress responsive a b barrel domain protein n=1 Tax=Colletotrichum truncatum TaxID=5467 RepID=A0ACC3Z1Z4_COLTU
MAQQGGIYKVPPRFTYSFTRPMPSSQPEEDTPFNEKSATADGDVIGEKKPVTAAPASPLRKTGGKGYVNDDDWVVVPSNPEDDPEEERRQKETKRRLMRRTGGAVFIHMNAERSSVLFKLKPGVSSSQVDEMRAAGEAMVGVIPGLKSFTLGPPLASTAHRAQGFDMALMTVLDTEEQVLAYAGHPAHQKLHKLRESLCTETLAYDLPAP